MSALTCYTAPGVVFDDEAAMKQHYKSDWHRHNLKRKVAGLPPLSRSAYEERTGGVTAAGAASASAIGGCVSLGGPSTEGMSQKMERRLRREARQQEKHARSAANASSKSAHFERTKTMSEHEYIEHKMATAEGFDECTDLFSRHQSESMEANLEYMRTTHGFYIPYLDYVTDLAGLLSYLLEMVYVGNVAIVSGKQFHSLEAVQAHMRATGGCRMELEGHEDEYDSFYDLGALSTKSPLWEWVEESDDDDDDDDDDEAVEVSDVATPMETVAEDDDDDDAAGGGGDEEDALSALFERCARLSLITEAHADRLTDAVASGEATEASLIAEWTTKLAHAKATRKAAKAAAASAGDGASVATSTRMMRVRYRPIGGGSGAPDEAGSLTFGRNVGKDGAHRVAIEAGHRSMRQYYKQSYRPEGGAIGVHNPQLHALMLQYAAAGVLATHLPSHGKVTPFHDRSKNQIHRDSKMFVKQGVTNNTTMNGMKHFKNQSLNF